MKHCLMLHSPTLINDMRYHVDMVHMEQEKSFLTAGSEGPLGRVKSVRAAPEGGVIARRHGLRLASPLEARQVLHGDRLEIQS